MVAVGCGSSDSGEAGAVEGTIRATTTTTHITDMVESIGGDEVEVTALMGPGVDPHLYEASQGDIEALQGADAIFYNGLFLEGQLSDLLVQVGQQIPTVRVTEAVPEDELLPSGDYEGQNDPHVWFDPELWVTGVDPVVEQLSELKPEAAEGFERRGEEYRREAMEAHEYVRERMESIPEEQRVLVTSHDAFGYFGEAYGFEVEGLQGLSTETEAGAGDVSRLADYLVEEEIPAIFVESSIPRRSVEAVQAAARDRGWDVTIPEQALYADAMGEPGTGAGTYAGMLRANADTIAGALR
ncbi:MAG: metal ABC transporter solute-binding protein, Zn/Mn family [Rubrobacteraceae bacterium]